MTARLRHHRRSGDVWMITVNPNTGGLTEQYRVTAAELRRFCWAALADLDPDEASAAAAEQGHPLELLVQGDGQLLQPMRRAGQELDPATYPPPKPGTKKFRILQILLEGQHTTDAVALRVPDAERPYDLLRELTATGFVARLYTGRSRRKPALWALTERGAAVLPAEAA
ncbi:MAG: hypothetical protein ACXU82_03650 [Caulobacteraceae bacterium]